MTPKMPKGYYSEIDAAKHFGISVEQLRTVVRDKIAKPEDAVHVPGAIYRSSDLLALGMILSGRHQSEVGEPVADPPACAGG